MNWLVVSQEASVFEFPQKHNDILVVIQQVDRLRANARTLVVVLDLVVVDIARAHGNIVVGQPRFEMYDVFVGIHFAVACCAAIGKTRPNLFFSKKSYLGHVRHGIKCEKLRTTA